jgi:hypothetical protein
MKLISLAAFILLMAGCAPKPAEAPTNRSCLDLYLHALNLVITENSDHVLAEQERKDAVLYLHSEFMKTGKDKWIRNYCATNLSITQVTCMMNANSIAGMGVCEHMFDQRKKTK